MSNIADAPRFDGDLGEQAAMRYFCHEDALMWRRLDVMAVVQLATLSAAYYTRMAHGGKPLQIPYLSIILGAGKILPVAVLALGLFMTVLVFLLIKRSEAYRDAIKDKWLSKQFKCFKVPLNNWSARGGFIARIIFGLAVAIDIVFGAEILSGFLGLFP